MSDSWDDNNWDDPDWDDPTTWVRYGKCGYDVDQRQFYLPHQCQEWEIGDVEMMRRFIKACQDKLANVVQGLEK